MFNNRNTHLIFMNYTNKINRALNQTIFEINNIGETNSISHDFICQMLPYMEFALKISDYTLHSTNHAKSLSIAHSICKTYPEIMDDIKKLKSISLRFRGCSDCVFKYRKDFSQISNHTFSDFKKINCKQNINSYFMKLIGVYYHGESKILENLLKYKIFPQLRLIAEYMLCLNNQKSVEIRSI